MFICNLFEKSASQGPWSIEQFTGSRQSTFLTLMGNTYNNHISEKANTRSSVVDVEAEDAAKTLKYEKRRLPIEDAKRAAQAALAKARDLRVAETPTEQAPAS